LRLSNGKKKGEGNAKNGNHYLAWVFVEAAHFALRNCAPAKSFLRTQETSAQRCRGDQSARAQIGAGLLPHAARAQAL
jgi:hypothetical protein